MEETRYMISEAAKLVDVEQHTLRYWQDQLGLPIAKNQLGQRYYREEDITLLKKIKEMKTAGIQLKAIKMLLPNLDPMENLDTTELIKSLDVVDQPEESENIRSENQPFVETEEEPVSEVSDAASTTVPELHSQQDRMGQFRGIMKDILSDVLKENNVELSDTVSMNVTNSVIKEMDYLLRMKEEREEERYKQFDRMLREYQVSRTNSAAAKEKKEKRKKLFHPAKS